MKNASNRTRKLDQPWIPALLSILGAICYLLQLIRYATTQESVLDEGAYLYKGFLFVSGRYTLYQPYGPWSNHMPLAFLIPGAVQVIFGPGIRSGRYFAIFLAMVTLLGIWLLARRFGSRWWAAAAVWVVVLNPMLAKMYATAVSQGLVIAMLSWTLVLILGSDRKIWEISLGTVLAGLIFLTRVNMFLVLPAVVLYIFWEHGKKAGLTSALVGGMVILIGHAIYWPDILQIWTKLPRSLTPFLNTWRLPAKYEGIWQPNTSFEGRLLSFFQTIRFHFTVMVGVIASWLLWPAKNRWKSRSELGMSLFLSGLFLMLLVLHMWFSLTGDYCVFCMPGYMGFFFVLGLLILVIMGRIWHREGKGLRSFTIFGIILLILAGVGYSSFEDIGQVLIDLPIPSNLVRSATPGSVPLGAILINKFGIEARVLRRLLPAMFGFGSGLGFLFLSWLIYRGMIRFLSQKTPGFSFSYFSMVLFLVFGAALSPTFLLSGGYRSYDCTGNVIQTYEASGKHLDEAIPDGSLVYWKGTLSAVPMLYMQDIRIFPPQINDGYSYMTIGDDLDLIEKNGRWNEALSIRWVKQADYVLIEDRSFSGRLRNLIDSGNYQELPATPLTVNCRDNSEIRIFKNLQPDN